jgi:hypothetical protein
MPQVKGAPQRAQALAGLAESDFRVMQTLFCEARLSPPFYANPGQSRTLNRVLNLPRPAASGPIPHLRNHEKTFNDQGLERTLREHIFNSSRRKTESLRNLP